jgi:hypothetical protein
MELHSRRWSLMSLLFAAISDQRVALRRDSSTMRDKDLLNMNEVVSAHFAPAQAWQRC